MNILQSKQKTIFFLSHSPQIRWYAIFAQAMKKILPNVNIVLFVHGRDEYSYAHKYAVYDSIIDLIDGFSFNPNFQMRDLSISSDIIKLENDLNVSFFWEDLKVDRWVRAKQNASFSVQYINHAYEVFNNNYSRFMPILGFGESTMAIYRLAHRTFDRDQLPYIGPMSTRYSDRFYFEDDWYWSWNRCLKLYDSFVKKGIPDDLVDISETLYDRLAVRGGKPVVFENFKNAKQAGYPSVRLSNFFRRLLSVVVSLNVIKQQKAFQDNIRYSIIETSFSQKIMRIIRNRLDHYNYSKIVTTEINDDQSYSIYFLHYQPEYTVDSLGKFYHDQVNLISNIASSIPANHILYVKEHPGMVGLRELRYYKRIQEISNVVLLHHDTDSLELIKKAKIVFSIVGTVGLEAIFNNVPAILFGRYAFSDIGTCTFCDSYWKLSDLVREKLKQKSDVDMSRTAKALLAAKYKSSYPGKIVISPETLEDFCSDAKQHALVQEALEAEFRELGIL